MLFDMDTCEILALMDDHFISTMRVGATSAVASKYLARKDAKVMALLGSGEQAKTRDRPRCVRQLTNESLQPHPGKPRTFRQSNERGDRHRGGGRNSAEEAIRDADIVTAATNTVDPVIEGRWVEPGMHLNSIVGGDGFLPRKELDDEQ